MSVPPPVLKDFLLQFLFAANPSRPPDPSRLDGDDWDRLLGMVTQHRLGPLFHWQAGETFPHLPIPTPVLQACAESFRLSKVRALMVLRELRQIDKILAGAGIPYAALKGSALAFHAYPLPGLRPMVDIDILVPGDDVLRAYDALLDGGYLRLVEHPGSPESCAKRAKHLPRLRSAPGLMPLELHNRLHLPDGTPAGAAEACHEDGLWAHVVTHHVAGVAVPHLSPTDELLHLVVHAIDDHHFGNGPVLIADILHLVTSCDVDWTRLWNDAATRKHTNAVALALTLAMKYSGTSVFRGIDIGSAVADVDDDILETALCLMLPDAHIEPIELNLHKSLSDATGYRDMLRRLLGKLMPDRTTLSTLYPVSAESPSIYLWYPVHWLRLGLVRMPSYLMARNHPQMAVSLQHLNTLNNWLRNHG